MNNCENDKCSSGIYDILKKILVLQKQDFECDNYLGCDRPYLGPTINNTCYNTRPIELYICCNGNPWTFDYNFNNTTGSTNILRIESLDDCCATCRLLIQDESTDTITSTNQFVTIDLKCCGAIRCYSDIYLDLC